jgi:hypothetical protein
MPEVRCLLVWAICFGASLALADQSEIRSAASLRAKYVELRPQLANSPFSRPIYLDSSDADSHVKGDIYALVHYPFAVVNEALNDPAHWCDMLLLHVYTRECHSAPDQGGSSVVVNIERKAFALFDNSFTVSFLYRTASTSPDYFDLSLTAATGPMGTSDYRVLLQAIAAEEGATFVHFSYANAYGFAGRMVMQTYLATLGRDKVGFTKTAQHSSDRHSYIGGTRGVVERNTMRYFLALEAYLAALSTPPPGRREMRLQSWFTSTEQYARQLHEVDRATYLEMKR